jgi:uncharacterized protein YceK
MRRILLVIAAAALLSGCAGILSDAYDEQARSQCVEETDPNARRACLDRVEQNRRERD